MKRILQGVTAAFACAAFAANPLAAQQDAEQAQVKVDNRSAHEVVVYAVVDGGDRYRLGKVNRLSTSEFTIPAALADGATQFRLKLYSYEAPKSYTYLSRVREAVKTNLLAASPGETIRLLVGARLTESYIPSL